jgi:hypothetical protein
MGFKLRLEPGFPINKANNHCLKAIFGDQIFFNIKIILHLKYFADLLKTTSSNMDALVGRRSIAQRSTFNANDL